MQGEGCVSRYPLERLSVMGIVAILKRLPELLSARNRLAREWSQEQPDLFIGIDAPEFNLGLEEKLRNNGVLTAHFVSPSVWAWRQKRIFKIKRAVDLMMTLFPFETAIYQHHGIRVTHVGHPLADELPMQPDRAAARQQLQLPADKKVIAVLPGSRGSELQHLSEPFIQAMLLLQQRDPSLYFVVPCANAKRRAQFERSLQQIGRPPNLLLVDGQSHMVMTAANIVLLASGTATLEAMLLKRPMVVAYKVGGFSYWLFKKLLKINRFSLPNLLAGKDVVPELMQDDATPEALSAALLQQLNDPAAMTETERLFTQLHESLRCNAAQRAADAVVALLHDKGKI
jgi:lipid-A-disaccharide synthase